MVASQTIPLTIPTTIVPPSNPPDPVTVFLVDYGTTPSLVLPVDDNRMVAYAYGDWAYYALRRQGPLESIAALLWPTQGTLGRREIIGPITAETVRCGVETEIQDVLQFTVGRADVDRLRARLDRIHEDYASTATRSYGMTFVHHPKPYTYWSNSNRMTAEWLRELGCEVTGPALGSWWRIRPSAAAKATRPAIDQPRLADGMEIVERRRASAERLLRQVEVGADAYARVADAHVHVRLVAFDGK